MRSHVSARELAALRRVGEAPAMLEASVVTRRGEADASLGPAQPGSARAGAAQRRQVAQPNARAQGVSHLAADVARDVVQLAVLERVAARFRAHLAHARGDVAPAAEERLALVAPGPHAGHLARVGASNQDRLFDVRSLGRGRTAAAAGQHEKRAEKCDGLEIAWNSD